jgi:indolepyruvate ferredoxin oxidoreductase alpha subunit
VALDFFTHLSMTGLGGGEGAMLLAVCDDPDGHSSGDETDSRWLARFAYFPLIEPSDIAEARELVKFGYDLSREFSVCVMLRSYTRLSHSSSIVEPADIQPSSHTAKTDPQMCLTPYLAKPTHAAVLERLEKIRKIFEGSKFNHYEGPSDAELVLVCSGSGVLCARDALELLGVEDRVGILKLATLWPFPHELVVRTLGRAKRVLVVEEVDPFVEVLVKSALVSMNAGGSVFGRESGHIEEFGEITVDRVVGAVSSILGLESQTLEPEYRRILDEEVAPLLIDRGLAWCPGCPHRASFYAIGKALKGVGKGGCLTGDIGCYTLDVFPGGKHQTNILHAMGSGAGLANGLGQLKAFGYDQPVLSLCGDSTFFHAGVPALINAVHNGSSFLQVILDNSTTAMTGFQPHPGTPSDAMGRSAITVSLESLCRSIGCSVHVIDPFDIKGTIRKVRELINEQNGVRVLILRRQCELLRMRKEKETPYRMTVDLDACRGKKCGVCLSQLRCPGLAWDSETGKTEVRGDMCSGCGVCADICPFKAIKREENK